MPRNEHLYAQFELYRDIANHQRAKCIRCGADKAWNSTQFGSRHLEKCAKYKAAREEEINGERLSKRLRGSNVHDSSAPKDLDIADKFALAMFTSTVAFSQSETPEWKDFFKCLNFELPSRHAISGPTLDSLYYKVKSEVQKVADEAKYIQIVSDGSSNVSKHRVENISFMTGSGSSFYWKSTAIGGVKTGAEYSCNHLVEAAQEITRGDLRRWTAFSSDTCST